MRAEWLRPEMDGLGTGVTYEAGTSQRNLFLPGLSEKMGSSLLLGAFTSPINNEGIINS